MRRRAILGVSVAGALALAGCRTYRSSAPVATPALPAGGGPVAFTAGEIKLGAYVDLKGLSESDALGLRRRQLGKAERIVHRYYSWTDRLPTTLSYVPAGSTLMVSWRGPHYTSINGGSADKLIAAAARQLKDRRQPTLLRWGWDMNRDFYPWGGPANQNDPSGYVRAWRRLREIFADQGADNVSWVWSPNWNSHPDLAWNTAAHYYPGDEYVDWAGVSGYAQDQAPGDLFQNFYDTYASTKPIMLTEVGVVDRGGASKPQWIASLRDWVKQRPAIGAVVWFDTDTHPGSTEKWRIDSTSASLAAYRAMSDDPAFRG
jgi:hypothetical protein